MKELKRRIKDQIAEMREENIKQSNQTLRKYILEQIKPIRAKLNTQEYRSIHEFEGALKVFEETLMKDGPRLHNYKLIYTEAVRKLASQGADFLFKNFVKGQEKDKEMFKTKEKEFLSQIETITQERDTLRKEFNESTTKSDAKIAQLSYKLETLNTQLTMTSKTKEQE